MASAFLSAKWRQLAMLNYRVPLAVVGPHVPGGTDVDLWQGAAYVSIVGFMFRHTRVLGVPIPFHGGFEEVNLRTYVRRVVDGVEHRAVTFIRELVPRHAIALAARLMYNEPYRTVAMEHRIDADRVEYSWKGSGDWARLRVEWLSPAAPVLPGSIEEFITRRHWGYTRQRDGSTIEYEVRHRPWPVCAARHAAIEGDLAGSFGHMFADALGGPPDSAFLADGSSVTVHWPRRIVG